MNEVHQTLGLRNTTHGDFSSQAATYAMFQGIAQCSPNYTVLTPEERHALDMILTKISRILCGDAHFPDHWHDIAGYATLVERALTMASTPKVNPTPTPIPGRY